MLSGRILVADDEPLVRENLGKVFRQAGYDVTTVANGDQALAALMNGAGYDIVFSDITMPGADGLTVLRQAREIAPQTFVILVTGNGTLETAIEALRRGAYDYILKPFAIDEVLAKVARLMELRQLAWERQILRREVDGHHDFEQMVIGRSHATRNIMETIQKVAPMPSPVLVTGESGVGKEIVARAVHHYSNRANKPFLAINCAAIPEGTLESQLFGHVRGAFTGAVTAQEGLFRAAQGGTIFLDEIGEMAVALQARLLRVIQQKEILPVGATSPIRIDVRIIAASNRDLVAAVVDKQFREDLFYRLNVVHIEVPPLRERREDIPVFVDYFVRRNNAELKKSYKGVDNAAMRILLLFPWKGNIRELQNVVERAMILGDGEWIHPVDLPQSLSAGSDPTMTVDDNLKEAMRVSEKTHVENVLRKMLNDKHATAEQLGLSVSSLYRKLAEHGIDASEQPEDLGSPRAPLARAPASTGRNRR